MLIILLSESTISCVENPTVEYRRKSFEELKICAYASQGNFISANFEIEITKVHKV
jgi:hypothetical protein